MNPILTHLIGGICIGLGSFLWGWIARGWYSRRVVRKWLAQSRDDVVIHGGSTGVPYTAPNSETTAKPVGEWRKVYTAKPAPNFCEEDE